ncbi:sigma factor, partial [Loktanella sp. DJP18]|uniref:sigma factor n=1 Tax=Loktanella sp. DJP18 TaxID=3409788 RepID=UPI003BB4FFAE
DLQDRDDLTQDLLVDVLRRLPRYVPARGQLGAFAGVVIRNRSRTYAARARATRNRRGIHVPFDIPTGGKDQRELVDVLSEAASLWSWTGQMLPDPDRTLSLHSVLSRLTSDDLNLCLDLARENVTDLVKSGRYSRSGLYRRIAGLRRTFAALGFCGSMV